MTTGKTIALTRRTFLSEVMALVSAVLFLRGEGGWWLLMACCAWGGWIQGVGEVKEGRSSPWAWEGPFPTPGNTLRWNLISVAHESASAYLINRPGLLLWINTFERCRAAESGLLISSFPFFKAVLS